MEIGVKIRFGPKPGLGRITGNTKDVTELIFRGVSYADFEILASLSSANHSSMGFQQFILLAELRYSEPVLM